MAIHITERQVTINLDVRDNIGDRLAELKKQRDALLANSRIKMSIDSSGLEQAQRASKAAREASVGAMKDLSALGGALTGRTVPALAQYHDVLGKVAKAGAAIGPGLLSSLGRVSSEFERQRTLAQFWGTSGALHLGINGLKTSLTGFVAGGGKGFTSWIQNASSGLAQYRTALTLAAAAMIGMAAAAALSAKHSQNYIQSTLDSRLMERKLSDKKGAEAWVQSAQGTDWSAGRDSRMATFQTVMSKNPYMGQKAGQKATEDIEKFYFANMEMLKKKGFESAEQLASAISAPQLMGDDATKFEDIFGLGFSGLTPQARLGRLGTEAKGIDINKAVGMRPDEVLQKRLTATTAAMGDAVLPALNAVLLGFIKLSDVIGKIPGLGKAMGWGAVLLGAGAAGLVVVSMIGSLIPGLMMAATVMGKLGLVTKLMAAAQWLLNAAMTANPLGIAIMAIAGLIVILYALEKKFGLVSKAWKAFSESSIGKGIFAYIAEGKKHLEELYASLTKAYKSGGVGGVLKVALGEVVSNSPLFKLVGFMVDFIRKLWQNSTKLNQLFSAGMAIWQRMTEFFTWLLDSIKSGVQWIKDGLGITKAEKEAKVKEAAEKEGLYQAPSGKWGKILKDAPRHMQRPGSTSNTFESATPSDRLKRLIEEANNAPNSVFSKVGEVIAGAMSNIKALFDPVLNPLTKAITDLLDWLGAGEEEETPVEVINQQTGIGKLGSTSTGKGTSSGTGGIETPRQFYSVAPSKEFGRFDVLLGKTVIATYDTIGEANSNVPQMARGGAIRATGSIIGHGNEEVDPANVVVGGKTTLAKINEMFAERGYSGQGRSSGGGINANVNIDVHIDKVEKDVDIDKLITRIGREGADKLLFLLRNGLDNTSQRGIAYQRG